MFRSTVWLRKPATTGRPFYHKDTDADVAAFRLDRIDINTPHMELGGHCDDWISGFFIVLRIESLRECLETHGLLPGASTHRIVTSHIRLSRSRRGPRNDRDEVGCRTAAICIAAAKTGQSAPGPNVVIRYVFVDACLPAVFVFACFVVCPSLGSVVGLGPGDRRQESQTGRGRKVARILLAERSYRHRCRSNAA